MTAMTAADTTPITSGTILSDKAVSPNAPAEGRTISKKSGGDVCNQCG